MNREFLGFFGMLLALLAPSAALGATRNTGNNPCFLWIDFSTNGFGSLSNNRLVPRLSPDSIDIGVDVGPDGEIDYWMSEDRFQWLAEGTGANDGPSSPNKPISLDNWRRVIAAFDHRAGEQARIRIVDRSDEAYIAVNAVRLNFADGTVVPNGVKNGWFEDDPPLSGWTVLEGSVTDPAQLIMEDANDEFIYQGTRFFSTRVNGNEDTVVIESDTFTLEPITSFIDGMIDGGGSEMWNKLGVRGSDNGSGVYIDIGTETDNPNGRYDDGIDIPLLGHIAEPGDRYMSSTLLNTSGQEGKRAQIVVVDQSEAFFVAVDGWRMNWDEDHIVNGGFEDVPEDWTPSQQKFHDEHPSGGIPGWTVTNIGKLDGSEGDASVVYFDRATSDAVRSGLAWVGTAGFGAADAAFAGIELRSDVFTIEPIPDPASSVFLQFASALGVTKYDAPDAKGSVELWVDLNGDNEFFDETNDFEYRMRNEGMAWNRQRNGNHMDGWNYPDYRFYIDPAHQGLDGRIRVEETMTSPWGWLAVDDFYFWDGKTADLAFPNSDFEMGDMTNWVEEIDTPNQLRTWLAGSDPAWNEGLAPHRAMGRTHSIVDGDFAADSSDHSTDGGPGGDGARGFLLSEPFTIPSPSSQVKDWTVFE